MVRSTVGVIVVGARPHRVSTTKSIIGVVSLAMISLRKAFNLSAGGIVSLVGAGGKTSLMNALAEEFFRQGDSVLITTTTKIKKPTVEQCSALIVEKDPATLIESCRAALRNHIKVAAGADCPDPRNKLVGFRPEIVDALWHSGLFKWIVVEADGAARKPLKAPADHEPVIPAASQLVIGVVGLSAIGKPFSDRWVFRPELFARLSGLLPGEPITATAAARAISHPGGMMKGAPSKALKYLFLNQADTPERVEDGKKIAADLTWKRSLFERVIIGQLQPETRITVHIDLN